MYKYRPTFFFLVNPFQTKYRKIYIFITVRAVYMDAKQNELSFFGCVFFFKKWPRLDDTGHWSTGQPTTERDTQTLVDLTEDADDIHRARKA